MSRRKDRERFQVMRRLDPDYRGFRGYAGELSRGSVSLESMRCTVCGRTRNVPRGVAVEERDSFVCSSCLERQAAEAQGAVQSE